MEEYPSPAEGIGLENRQGCQNPRGFESLFLLHNLKLISYLAHKIWEIDKIVTLCNDFFFFASNHPKKRPLKCLVSVSKHLRVPLTFLITSFVQ